MAPITFAMGTCLFGLGLRSGSTLSRALTSILGLRFAGESNFDQVHKKQKRWSQVQDRNDQRLCVTINAKTIATAGPDYKYSEQ